MPAPVVRAPRGAAISCKAWPQEAALRMLMNNLDAEVAEKPEDLIVYGGKGKAARSWPAFEAIVRTLRALESDETLLIQSGKPVGVFRTHEWAPRVLIPNAMLVPKWSTWEEFWRLEAMGLTMFGQMTAGSWIYIGTQGIVQGTYETFAEVARRHFGGSLKGKLVLTAGLGGMGGAQPLAVTMNEGVVLVVEADPLRLERRHSPGWLDIAAHGGDAAARRARGAVAFDYGNNLRAEAKEGGLADAFAYPGFVPAYIRPLFAAGKGPFRWAALSGDPQDILKTDARVLELFPDNAGLARWIRLAQKHVPFQGLPARICWLGYGERHLAGLAFNQMVARGELAAPIAIGRDHMDSGSVASPHRETEGMMDGSDAIADWPILNALLNTSSGATWVSVHHGGAVGIGYSIHAGQVSVADGTARAAQKLARVLTADPGLGVVRHADAGYSKAKKIAREKGIRMPMLK